MVVTLHYINRESSFFVAVSGSTLREQNSLSLKDHFCYLCEIPPSPNSQGGVWAIRAFHGNLYKANFSPRVPTGRVAVLNNLYLTWRDHVSYLVVGSYIPLQSKEKLSCTEINTLNFDLVCCPFSVMPLSTFSTLSSIKVSHIATSAKGTNLPVKEINQWTHFYGMSLYLTYPSQEQLICWMCDRTRTWRF